VFFFFYGGYDSSMLAQGPPNTCGLWRNLCALWFHLCCAPYDPPRPHTLSCTRGTLFHLPYTQLSLIIPVYSSSYIEPPFLETPPPHLDPFTFHTSPIIPFIRLLLELPSSLLPHPYPLISTPVSLFTLLFPLRV
jgi:hypothetical protein